MVGQRLREIRQKLNLTLRDVETQSRHIAETRQKIEYLFTAGRLSQVESSNSLPSLFKLASLSEIYQTPYEDLLRLYGIEIAQPTQIDSSEQRSVAEFREKQLQQQVSELKEEKKRRE